MVTTRTLMVGLLAVGFSVATRPVLSQAEPQNDLSIHAARERARAQIAAGEPGAR